MSDELTHMVAAQDVLETIMWAVDIARKHPDNDYWEGYQDALLDLADCFYGHVSPSFHPGHKLKEKANEDV